MAVQVSYNTITVHFADIWIEHLERGLGDPMKDKLLHLLCIGIKRSQGTLASPLLPKPPNIEVTTTYVVTHHSSP